ncbi:MAG: amidohydrolase family protein [Armatimonadota bacterium]
MIDIHMHVGKLYFDPEITPEDLLRWMDENEVGRAALHPIESPEETFYYVTTDYVLDVCAQHPDRFIPFCNMDPRRGPSDASFDYYRVLEEYRERGCVGFGECMSGLFMDDPRLQEIYDACGRLGMPIIFHMDASRQVDEVGLPRMEKMIKKYPDTVFVGHGQHFWAEISADVKRQEIGGYPDGPVAPGGAVPHLLETYPNAYADISAGSGLNALTRDPEFGYQFMQEHQHKLFFGTDICHVRQTREPQPNLEFFRQARSDGHITQECYDSIAEDNALRVFDIEG